MKRLLLIVPLFCLSAFGQINQITNAFLGTLPNDGTGDPLRISDIKFNHSFIVVSNELAQVETNIHDLQLTTNSLNTAQMNQVSTNAALTSSNMVIAIGVGGVNTNALVLKTNGFATRLNFNSAKISPTNIYTFGLISCSNIASGGTASAWYSPNHAWSNMGAGSISLVGDQFAIGNDQYHIVGVSNGNDSFIFAIPYGTPPHQGYTNVSAIYYPLAVRMDDINGKQCGYLGSAGDHGFIDTDSSGANATEDMIIIEKTNSMTFRLYRRPGTFVGGVKFSTLKGLVGSDPIDIDINAPYESFEVFESGLIGARFGFTNVFDTGIWIDRPIFTNSFQAYSKSKAGVGTVTSAADNRTIDCSGANFGALKIGDVFIVGGGSYTIRGIVDSDTIQVIEDLTPGFTAQAWSTVPASHTFNESPTVTAWSSERGMGVNTIQSGDGPSLYILGGTGQTNAFSVRYTSHGANVGILAFISTITGGDIFDIDGHAPYESLEILRDGTVGVRIGFTNNVDNLPIPFYSPLKTLKELIAPTNTAPYTFTVTTPTTLLVTNGPSRGGVVLKLAFDDANGGAPSCTIISTNQISTNNYGTLAPINAFGLTLLAAGSITNDYYYPMQTNSLLKVTDTSSGAGAAVRVIQATLVNQ